MGSRIRNDVDKLYICFCKIAQPESPDREARIIEKYPEDYSDDQILNSVPKFAFPCEFEKSTIQHFSFVLTEANSKWTFGFCRHDPEMDAALVFLSHLPWLEEFVKVLNSAAELIKSYKPDELSHFLYVLYSSRVPKPGKTLTVAYDNNKSTLSLQNPPPFQLPTIPESRNLTEYYNAVDINNMLVIFASMLYERRIVFKSKRLLRLSACVQAANAIIYPMHWQHIFIPVLPKHLVDYLLAPMPFLIGVPSAIWENVRQSDLGDIVVLDADTNALETPFNDVDSLPHDVVKFLKTQLRNRQLLMGDGLPRIFLRALVQLIGGYRDALKFPQGQRITFSEEAFVQSRPTNMQPFLRDVLHLQIFQQFIEERLDLLNTGRGFSDEFEREACNYTGKSGSKIKAQYREYVATMRTQGSAFLKTVKNKANPAVKSAVKSVREKGKDVKTAYKGIRSKMKRETTLFYDHSSKMGPPQPRSAPSSPTSNHISRFNTKPVSVTTTYKKQIISLAPSMRSNEYAPLKPPCDDLISTNSETDSASKSDALPRLNMDLMEDLQEVINRQFSLADKSDSSPSPPTFRNLKPVRSLGTFQPHKSLGTSLSPAGLKLQSNGDGGHPPLAPALSLPPPQTAALLKMNPLSSDPFGFAANLSSTTTGNITTSHSRMNPFMPDLVQTSFKPIPNVSVINDHAPSLFGPTPTTHSSNPVPQASTEQIKGSGSVGDLIRLDSVPGERIDSFDPLDSVGTSSSGSNSNSNDSIPFKEGLMNPLYPYYSLNGRSSADNHKLFPNSNSNLSNSSFFQSNSTPSPHHSNHKQQDLDLLKEYDLDFTSSATNKMESTSKSMDPFELAFDNVLSRKDLQNNWTTFD